jgi:Winged helix-turn helix
VIELSGEERAELERRVACCTLPHSVVVRGKMILYAAEGQSTAEIARRLETAPRVVNRWRKRFFEVRLAGLEDRERGGRPRRFPPGAGGRAEGTGLSSCRDLRPFSQPFSRTELHRLVVERGLSEASASTIRRWLHDDALKPWQQRSWIFVRDPDFALGAGRVLDLKGGSRSTTGATAPPPTWPAGTSTTPSCSTGSRRKQGSNRSGEY